MALTVMWDEVEAVSVLVGFDPLVSVALTASWKG
jgi:hypothetical protein